MSEGMANGDRVRAIAAELAASAAAVDAEESVQRLLDQGHGAGVPTVESAVAELIERSNAYRDACDATDRSETGLPVDQQGRIFDERCRRRQDHKDRLEQVVGQQGGSPRRDDEAGEASGAAVGIRSGSSDVVAPPKKRTRFVDEGGEMKNEGVNGGADFIEAEVDNQGENQESGTSDEPKNQVENNEDEGEDGGNREEAEDQAGNYEEGDGGGNSEDEAEANGLSQGSFLAPRDPVGVHTPPPTLSGPISFMAHRLPIGVHTPPPTRYDQDEKEGENESEAEGVCSDDSDGAPPVVRL